MPVSPRLTPTTDACASRSRQGPGRAARLITGGGDGESQTPGRVDGADGRSIMADAEAPPEAAAAPEAAAPPDAGVPSADLDRVLVDELNAGSDLQQKVTEAWHDFARALAGQLKT